MNQIVIGDIVSVTNEDDSPIFDMHFFSVNSPKKIYMLSVFSILMSTNLSYTLHFVAKSGKTGIHRKISSY